MRSTLNGKTWDKFSFFFSSALYSVYFQHQLCKSERTSVTVQIVHQEIALFQKFEIHIQQSWRQESNWCHSTSKLIWEVNIRKSEETFSTVNSHAISSIYINSCEIIIHTNLWTQVFLSPYSIMSVLLCPVSQTLW